MVLNQGNKSADSDATIVIEGIDIDSQLLTGRGSLHGGSK